MKENKNLRFKILIFLLIICSLIIEFYQYKDDLIYYYIYYYKDNTDKKNYGENSKKSNISNLEVKKNDSKPKDKGDKKIFTNIYSELIYQNLYLGKAYYKSGNLKLHNYLDSANKKLISESYYEDGTLLSKAIYSDISMTSDSEYYIEYRKDGTKFYEVQKIDKDNEIEKFFDRNGCILHENIKESDF